MANDTNLKVDGLEYAEIRNNLVSYLKTQSEFQDYNFDSSGLSSLLDLGDQRAISLPYIVASLSSITLIILFDLLHDGQLDIYIYIYILYIIYIFFNIIFIFY